MSRAFALASSQYLEVSSSPISAGPGISLACWFYATEGSNLKDIMSVGDWSRNHVYLIRLTISETVRGLIAGSGTTQVTTAASFSLNTWAHACFVSAGSTDHRIYLNGGNEVSDNTSATADELDTIAVGCSSYNGSRAQYMDGYLAEVGLWNIGLTAADVAQLGAGFAPPLVRPEYLVAYWPLIRDTDDDVVGGYNLTATNNPTIATHPPDTMHPAPPHVLVPTGVVCDTITVTVTSTITITVPVAVTVQE